jgi:hypothetical protein
MSARLTCTSVTRDRALDTYEPSCVSRAAKPFLFMWSTARWGPWGTWQHRSSPLGEASSGPCGSAWVHLDRETRFRVQEHVAAPELFSRGGRSWSHGTRASAGAHLDREVRSGTVGHATATEPTSVGRCDPKLQFVWQCVDAHPTPCLNLELICGVLDL